MENKRTNENEVESRRPKRKRSKWIYILLGIAALVIIGLIVSPAFHEKGAVYKNYTVERGTISAEAMASGYVYAGDSENIDIPDGLEIEELIIDEGQDVSAGDRLAKLDYNSVLSCYTSIEAKLRSVDQELSGLKAQNGDSAYIASPASGRVKAVYCQEGDDVLEVQPQNGALMLISSDGYMRVMPEQSDGLKMGMDIKLRSGEDGQEPEAHIQRGENGGLIILADDDELDLDENLDILDESGNKITSGKAVINAPVSVIYGSGIVDEVYYEVGDSVSVGTRLMRVKDVRSLSYNAKLNERGELAEQLSELAGYLKEPFVCAKADGVIKEINVSEKSGSGSAGSVSAAASAYSISGMTSDMAGMSSMAGMSGMGGMTSSGAYGGSGNSGSTGLATSTEESAGGVSKTTAFVLAKTESMQIEAYVDELDVPSVEEGQSVRISINALEDREFNGKVTFVSEVGDGQDGFKTVIELEEADESVKEGMYANVYITTAKTENALVIPLEIVEEDIDGEFVYLDNGNGREKRYIETGLSDGIKVEVISGLSEGDTLSYEQTDQRLNGMMKMFMEGAENMSERGESGRNGEKPERRGKE